MSNLTQTSLNLEAAPSDFIYELKADSLLRKFQVFT